MELGLRELRQSELHWLTRRHRGLIVPRLVVDESLTSVSGYYAHPDTDALDVNGVAVSRVRGVIVINACFDPCTLAHEYRHHWQWCNGIQFQHVEWNWNGTWEQSIARFFAASWTERDAMRFERKMYPSHFNEQVLDAAPFVACGL